MDLTFRSVCEAEPGEKWRASFARHWPSYRRWYLSEGIEAVPAERRLPESAPFSRRRDGQRNG